MYREGENRLTGRELVEIRLKDTSGVLYGWCLWRMLVI